MVVFRELVLELRASPRTPAATYTSNAADRSRVLDPRTVAAHARSFLSATGAARGILWGGPIRQAERRPRTGSGERAATWQQGRRRRDCPHGTRPIERHSLEVKPIMDQDNELPTDIFDRMNAIAASTGACNLGHGFTEDLPPPIMSEVVVRALAGTHHQYSESEGLVELRRALARRAARRGRPYDARDEITVTAGCAEAIVAGLLATASKGGDVLALGPAYDLYRDFVAVAGARLIEVPLPEVGAGAEWEARLLSNLALAMTRSSRVLLLNSPHNPTGHVLSLAALTGIAELILQRDMMVISDEVYDEFVYDAPHASIAAIPTMRDRTIVCSSATKMLSASGWRVGWAYAPKHLSTALRDAHRAMTFCAPTPLQAGVAAALDWADDSDYFQALRRQYAIRRDLLVSGLAAAGFAVVPPAGGVFAVCNVENWLQHEDVYAFGVRLAHQAGVVAIPLYSPTALGPMKPLLRFAFCKTEDTIRKAVARLERYAASRVVSA